MATDTVTPTAHADDVRQAHDLLELIVDRACSGDDPELVMRRIRRLARQAQRVLAGCPDGIVSLASDAEPMPWRSVQ